MDKPMTTTEYFNLISNILREQGQMPDEMLDYCMATSHEIPVTTYEFDTQHHLGYGASEGIYLDLAIRYYENEELCTRELGTFKTLETDPQAMRTMAQLLADFLVAEHVYVNSHIDDFNWQGYEVYGIRQDGSKQNGSYGCATIERAIHRKDLMLLDYPSVAIRDNATRKVNVYHKNGVTKHI